MISSPEGRRKIVTLNYLPYVPCSGTMFLLGQIVDLLYSFKNSRKSWEVSDMSEFIAKKLYSTYLSYLSDKSIFLPSLK